MHILISVLFTVLLVTFVATQPTIKSDWAQVNVKPCSPYNEGYFIQPRAAAFSDGRYIIVYTVNDTLASVAVGQIFFANGSIAKEEFLLAPDLAPDALLSPNIVVFNDDTFLVVYRWGNVGANPLIYAQRFDPEAKPIGNAFRVDDPTRLSSSVLQDGVELIGFADKSFGIIYYSGVGCLTGCYFNSEGILQTTACIIPSTNSIGASIVADRSRTTAHFFGETTNANYAAEGEITVEGDLPSRAYYFGLFSVTNPVVALNGDRFITYVFNDGDNMHYAVSEVDVTFTGDVLFPSNGTTQYSSPAIIGLNETSVFLGYKYTESSQSYFAYQTATLVPRDIVTELIPNPDVVSVLSTVRALQFIPMLGSDILVIGKNAPDGRIMRQILTFCGNGQLEINEECDGSANCDAQCRCTNDLIGYKGVCGLPNIIPVLDCVQSVSNGHNLHFSFINEDGIVQVMEHGYQNMFTPTNLAADRPTSFDIGATLTYPASAYLAFVGSDVSSINWVLGSYNLTVDLTNVAPLQCPDSVGFVSRVTTTGSNFDGGFELMKNYAVRYDLSLDRLTFDTVQSNDSMPTNTSLGTYDVTITVAPANATNSEELTPEDAVKSVLVDSKNNFAEVAEDLLNGYDPESNVKDITPLPTGVEVRGTRYDSSNVFPPSTPTFVPSTASFTGPICVAAILFAIVLLN